MYIILSEKLNEKYLLTLNCIVTKIINSSYKIIWKLEKKTVFLQYIK